MSSMDDPIRKFVVFVPTCFNDGTDVPKEVFLDFQDKLFVLANGYTINGTVEGAYRMADGKKQIDHSVVYGVGIPASKADELKEIVGELGETLGQESMYLEDTGSTISFVPPKTKGGKKK